MRRALLVVAAAAAMAVAAPASSQDSPLDAMIAAERAFAARALASGWKQAYLEYFADSAVWPDDGRAVKAKTLFRKAPDPASDVRFEWEPRHGEIAASGDLGYLTGPLRIVDPSRGRPTEFIYASVWKKQKDGAFRVVMHARVPARGPVTFPEGIGGAARDRAEAGTAPVGTTSKALRDTDAALTKAEVKRQAAAYQRYYSEDAVAVSELGRATLLSGRDAIVRSLTTEVNCCESAKSMFADVSLSGDLGYTYGSYDLKADDGTLTWFYLRVWTRGRGADWKAVLDVRTLP